MTRKNPRNTKSRIVDAAWKLFYEQGYEDTTVEEIVALSETSKGSFYHYFTGKDDLLGSLSYLFDEKYEELDKSLSPTADAFDTLLFLNRELFKMIEDRIDISLLTRLLSTQLTLPGSKQLLDQNRVYFKLLRRIVTAGQEKGELTKAVPAREIVRLYALSERALLYDWCLGGGGYSLATEGEKTMALFLCGLRAKK